TSKGMYAEYMPPERAEDSATQDPHCLVQCRADPDALWVQHHNGVFRSTDGAETWKEVSAIKPSKFGFGVAVHPDNPDRAWFVPAVKDECRVPVDGAVVVARTSDGGKSFDVLRRGLPQQHAYDLVLRHALAIDKAGKWLAIGSTSGHLWTSGDQGDAWQLAAGNLPPIYALRFARA
ncbi:MAG TPA: exo-alpha-sialidase, partial [Candidatus Polarisedimenticolia bacterium]|nr:exo-alpha-sialidase [Candidatus Polarisedimenticolia bacterium]